MIVVYNELSSFVGVIMIDDVFKLYFFLGGLFYLLRVFYNFNWKFFDVGIVIN